MANPNFQSAPDESQGPKYAMRSVGELSANPRNARTHSDAQIAKLAKSITKFKFLNPIIIDGAGTVIAGHGRLQAALSLGMDEVPCLMADHLTEAEQRAYMLADNRMALESGWDEEILRVELADLKALDFDLDFTGFDDSEFSEILDDILPLSSMPEMQSGEKSPFQQMTFTLHDDQAEIVRQAIAAAKDVGAFLDSKNENSNGNALARICESYVDRNR